VHFSVEHGSSRNSKSHFDIK